MGRLKSSVYWSRRTLVFMIKHSRWTGALLFLLFVLWRALRLDFNDKIWRVHPMLGTTMDREVYRSRHVISNLPSILTLQSIGHNLGHNPVVSDEVWRVLLDFSFHSWNFCASTIRLLWTLSRCVYQFGMRIYPYIVPIAQAYWNLPLMAKLYLLCVAALTCLTTYLWQKGYIQRAMTVLRIWHVRVADALANYGPYVMFLSLVYLPLKQSLSLPHSRVLHQNLLFLVAIAYSLVTSVGIVVLRRYQEMLVAYGIVDPPKNADGSLTRRAEIARRNSGGKLPPGTDLSRPPTGVVVASTVLGMTTPRGLSNAVKRSAGGAPLKDRKTILRQAVVHILTFWAVLTLAHALFYIPERIVELLLRAPLPVFSLWSIGSGYITPARRIILTPSAVQGYDDIIFLKYPPDYVPHSIVSGIIAPRLAWALLTAHELLTTVLIVSVLLQHDRFGDWLRKQAVDFLEYLVLRVGGLQVVLVNRVRRSRQRQLEKDFIFGDTDSPAAGYLNSVQPEEEALFADSMPVFPREAKAHSFHLSSNPPQTTQSWLGHSFNSIKALYNRVFDRWGFITGLLPIQKLTEVFIYSAPLAFVVTPNFICRPAFLAIALFIPMLYGLKGLYRRALEKAVYWQTYYTALLIFIASLDLLASSSPIAAYLVFAVRPKFAAVMLIMWVCTEPDVLGLWVMNTASKVSKQSVQVALHSARRHQPDNGSEKAAAIPEDLISQSAPTIDPAPMEPSLTRVMPGSTMLAQPRRGSSGENPSAAIRRPSLGDKVVPGRRRILQERSSAKRKPSVTEPVENVRKFSKPDAPGETAFNSDTYYQSLTESSAARRRSVAEANAAASTRKEAADREESEDTLFRMSKAPQSETSEQSSALSRRGMKSETSEANDENAPATEGEGIVTRGRRARAEPSKSVQEVDPSSERVKSAANVNARREARRKGTDVSATSTATITSRRESSLSGSTSGAKKTQAAQPKIGQRILRSHAQPTDTPPTAVV